MTKNGFEALGVSFLENTSKISIRNKEKTTRNDASVFILELQNQFLFCLDFQEAIAFK